MSRTRRLLLHAILVPGFWVFGFIFLRTSVGNPSPALLLTAAVACLLVGIGFAVRLAAIARRRSPAAMIAAPAAAGGAPARDWRMWGLVAWAIVCLAASVSEMFGGGPPDAAPVLSPFSTTLLVSLFAWQAFRVMNMERRLQGS